MNKDEFSKRILALSERLIKVARSQLSSISEQEEAVSECVARSWEKLPQLKEEAFFETWVTRILINICHDSQRRRPTEELREDMAYVDETDAELIDLKTALFSLDGSTRLIVVLFHVEGYSIREIADLLDMPQGTVSSKLSRGRASLRAILSKEDKGDEDGS